MGVRIDNGSRPALPAAGTDRRLVQPRWSASVPSPARLLLVRAIGTAGAVLLLWYFGWLLHPDRVGHPLLYGLLIAAELFNLAQAGGFWWTVARQRRRRPSTPNADPRPHAEDGRPRPSGEAVDVLIPTCGEPIDVVAPTIRAARAMRGADVRVHVLDDGPSDEVRRLARELGVSYVRRPNRAGAKAGSLNRALRSLDAPYVAVFDSDHVPDESFLERTLPHLTTGDRVAFVQTPQYYANGHEGGVAGGAWAQQALFFGAIARGKDGHGSMFCCGTNVVFSRSALDDVGGFPESSVTEDFELSIRLLERGWESAYVPEVLASGLGPDDMASYVSQQHRWARGCVEALPRIARSRLPMRRRVQFLLSSMYFLSGWTVVIYMLFPVLRLWFGVQPVATSTADQFLLHFLPYYACALGAVAVAGDGAYTFRGFALAFSTFWVHVHASLRAVLRRPGGFVVTPKVGATRAQPRAVVPVLAAVAVLGVSAAAGLVAGRDPGRLNNVAFALMHIGVLLTGAWPALRPRDPDPSARPVQPRPAVVTPIRRPAIPLGAGDGGAFPAAGLPLPAAAARDDRRHDTPA